MNIALNQSFYSTSLVVAGTYQNVFSPTPTIVIDNHDSQLLVESDGHQKFIKQNLYSKDAPTFVQNYVKKKEH